MCLPFLCSSLSFISDQFKTFPLLCSVSAYKSAVNMHASFKTTNKQNSKRLAGAMALLLHLCLEQYGGTFGVEGLANRMLLWLKSTSVCSLSLDTSRRLLPWPPLWNYKIHESLLNVQLLPWFPSPQHRQQQTFWQTPAFTVLIS